MRPWSVATLIAAVAALAGMPAAAAPSPFANWAAIVVSGDFHAAHTNNPTETFDNARRDVSAELIRKGFSAANLLQFSVRPQLYPDLKLGPSAVEPIYQGLNSLTQKARGGCLAYFTSHGAPQGVVLGDDVVSPERILQVIGEA